MSDLLEKYRKTKLDWQLKGCSEAPLTYVRQQADLFSEIIFCDYHDPYYAYGMNFFKVFPMSSEIYDPCEIPDHV